ncbi:MAG: response regulator, partial [Planctomycetota bacterium]
MRVLVVDDEPVARRVLLRFLREDPQVAQVSECSTGEAARVALEDGEVDVVFLDIHMPGIDGFEALEARAPGVPLAVVFVTAYEEHALRAIDVGAAAYLLKPFDQEGFERAFERAKAQLHRDRVVRKSAELSELLGGGRAEASPAAPGERITIPEGTGLR